MRIFSRAWTDIEKAQQQFPLDKPVKTIKVSDYGCDPVGNGKFRMVPSGDLVNYTEKEKRLRG